MNVETPKTDFDIVVAGGGHAGCEAALAAARSGCRTLLATLNLEKIASMPCNPAVGGIAKSHLVFEIDALGGEMARNADWTGLQFRVLNTSRGAAVRANRVQCDKGRYSARMRSVLENQSNLTVVEDEAVALALQGDIVRGVRLLRSGEIGCRAVILCVGTFLRGTIHVGHETTPGGGNGQPPSNAIADQLRASALHCFRLKTGTPPRLLPESIDWGRLQRQDGETPPPFFSAAARNAARSAQCRAAATAVVGIGAGPAAGAGDFGDDGVPRGSWKPVPEGGCQFPCFVTHTTEETCRIVRERLSDTALYGGDIVGVGPRYCPSFEDKVVKFADRTNHHVFLEPESADPERNLVYPNGLSTSLPRDAQIAMIHSVPGLERAEFAAFAYAIEYDAYDPRDLRPTLGSRLLHGLWIAGQPNGTTGYEEAAAQGLLAGVNAARSVKGLPDITFSRTESYLGVMVDDLTTKGVDEPYRMFTSRSECRLSLRQDNARFRLLAKAREIGIAPQEELDRTESDFVVLAGEIARMDAERVQGVALSAMLCRSGVSYCDLPGALNLSPDLIRELELTVRYRGYVELEAREARETRRREAMRIPADLDYASISALRHEAREKLGRVRPENLGQAGRIPGLTPADLAVLGLAVEKRNRGG